MVDNLKFTIVASEERTIATVQIINGKRIKKEYCEYCGRLVKVERPDHVPISTSYYEHDCPKDIY